MSAERIGRGPWARLFASAVVPDEGSSTAEARTRARRRRRGAASSRSPPGSASGAASAAARSRLGASPCRRGSGRPSPGSRAATSRSRRGVSGREQSVHLEHLLTRGLGGAARPAPRRARGVRARATGAARCEHVAALAYAFAQEIDRDPSLLLRWRGSARPKPRPSRSRGAGRPTGDPWLAGPLPHRGRRGRCRPARC